MTYKLPVEKVRWKELLVAAGHSVISVISCGALWVLLYGEASSAVLALIISGFVVVTVPLYIMTGIPNVVRHNCRNCNELMNSGKAYCDNCGNQLRSNSVEMLWFILGYNILMLVGTPLVIYTICSILGIGSTSGTPLSFSNLGTSIFFIMLPGVLAVYSFLLFTIYRVSRWGYINMKQKNFT